MPQDCQPPTVRTSPNHPDEPGRLASILCLSHCFDSPRLTFSADAAPLQGPELDHDLFRLKQSLAVSTSTMKAQYQESLSNPAEMLDGMLHLCLNPHHLPSRMLLLRTLRKLRKSQPDLTE